MKKHKEEQELTVKLLPSVAKDVITVLAKFSQHRMRLMTFGDKSEADRLLALNLFRVHVEEQLRRKK